ncbi:AraC family transcriptional regulator [Parapedobacter pyrenivorans]|uniref:AraC family transcriptional regulator n=1 Tax=Parapedobacter pyrenivorans TaxID=1305674 RepID=A0A917HV95_9SPHI|nr:AraC family transcriptional regulator [Parapedobacter pyrenivorans]GGG91874.1 AraC family transcriptional regulator [Parapedobacter pyrenivorans]
MKPQLLKVSTGPAHSFSARRDTVPYANNRWHYHQEIELIHFEKGRGTQFIGDSIRNFGSGDVVLIGSNLPHYWSFDSSYFDKRNQQEADVRVTHFNDDFWGAGFLDLPENTNIKQLLQQAKQGISVNGVARIRVQKLLEELLVTEGTKRIILLIEALTAIAHNTKDIQLLSSVGFNPHFQRGEKDRINNIYDFALQHFRQRISLDEVAEVAGMSSNAFCRYFKSRTGKTFSQFLIEIRVGHACKLLIENNMNVKQICYESGFHNFAGFHKYFKQITGKSPLNYQRAYLK